MAFGDPQSSHFFFAQREAKRKHKITNLKIKIFVL